MILVCDFIYLKFSFFDNFNNPKITKVNHMTNLKVLKASYNCGIDDKGIMDNNLEKIYMSHNSKITNVNHMKNAHFK